MLRQLLFFELMLYQGLQNCHLQAVTDIFDVFACPAHFNGAGQSAAGYDIKPQAAMEMLSTCEGRLQALMAEANLMGESVSSQGEVSPEDAELHQAFASTLIESGMAIYYAYCISSQHCMAHSNLCMFLGRQQCFVVQVIKSRAIPATID